MHTGQGQCPGVGLLGRSAGGGGGTGDGDVDGAHGGSSAGQVVLCLVDPMEGLALRMLVRLVASANGRVGARPWMEESYENRYACRREGEGSMRKGVGILGSKGIIRGLQVLPHR